MRACRAADTIVSAVRTATEGRMEGSVSAEWESVIHQMLDALHTAEIARSDRKHGLIAAKQVAAATLAIVKKVCIAAFLLSAS